ncbi:MAG: hypothetical protein IJO43_00650 [Bacilli bacterium]|nr:hypothetical protein [Bacilli bacterium]
MDFIIDFFIGIDGWLYYTILVINTILIFAIIGYLGEKNNEQLLKVGMAVSSPNIKSGTTNLTPTHSSAPVNQNTTVQNGQPINHQQVNTVVPNNAQINPSNVTSGVTNSAQSHNLNQNISPTTSNEQTPSVLVINSTNVNKDVK